MRASGNFNAKHFVGAIVKTRLASILKKHGFRKSHNTFWRNNAQWCDVISIQMDRWGSATHSSVGIRVGVWWHAIERIANPGRKRMPPTEYQCTVRDNIGERRRGYPFGRDWDVNVRVRGEELGQALESAIKRRAIPWIESAHVLKNLAKPHQMPYAWNQQLVAMVLLRRRAEAQRRLADVYERVYMSDPKLHSDLPGLAKRLGLQFLPKTRKKA